MTPRPYAATALERAANAGFEVVNRGCDMMPDEAIEFLRAALCVLRQPDEAMLDQAVPMDVVTKGLRACIAWRWTAALDAILAPHSASNGMEG